MLSAQGGSSQPTFSSFKVIGNRAGNDVIWFPPLLFPCCVFQTTQRCLHWLMEAMSCTPCEPAGWAGGTNGASHFAAGSGVTASLRSHPSQSHPRSKAASPITLCSSQPHRADHSVMTSQSHPSLFCCFCFSHKNAKSPSDPSAPGNVCLLFSFFQENCCVRASDACW